MKAKICEIHETIIALEKECPTVLVCFIIMHVTSRNKLFFPETLLLANIASQQLHNVNTSKKGRPEL